MSNTYQVTLTDTEKLGMEYCAYSVQDWIDNAAHNRARIAVDEIIEKEVKSCIAAGIQIPTTKEAIVSQAFERGTVAKAADVTPSISLPQ